MLEYQTVDTSLNHVYKDPVDPEFLTKAKEHGWGYPDYCRPGFDYINFQFRLNGDHQFAYDFDTLKAHLESVGFVDVTRRSYCPELDTRSRAEGTLYVEAKKAADCKSL